MTVIACPHCGKKNRVAVAASGIPRCGNCHNQLPWMVGADAASFDAAIKASVPVLVDFWAPWCGPCRMVSPVVEAIGHETAGRLKVVKLNIDEAPAISERYAIRGIPLLVLIRDGSEVDRLVGAVPRERLGPWLQAPPPAPRGAA